MIIKLNDDDICNIKFEGLTGKIKKTQKRTIIDCSIKITKQ